MTSQAKFACRDKSGLDPTAAQPRIPACPGTTGSDVEPFRDIFNHPLFVDSERRKAFEDLVSRPTGNHRSWARKWSWSIGRVQRFISALERCEIADITRTRYGTTIRFRCEADARFLRSSESRPDQSRSGADAQPMRLEKNRSTLGLGPRKRELLNESAEEHYAANCIHAINEGMLANLGPEFRPIMLDNRRSAKAAAALIAAGVELPFAIQEIRKGCLLFNPSKHGRGNPPGTLAYFEKSLLKAHSKRGQVFIPRPTVSPQEGAMPARGGGTALIGDAITSFMHSDSSSGATCTPSSDELGKRAKSQPRWRSIE